MKFCSECGANTEGKKFCSECGAPVAEAAQIKTVPKVVTKSPDPKEETKQRIRRNNWILLICTLAIAFFAASWSNINNPVRDTAVQDTVTEAKAETASKMTKYDYKQFVDDTIITFEPSAEISFSNYMEWDVDGTKYAKTTFKSKGLEHEFLMRFSTDTTQLFYASINGQKVFSNVDAEMTYMDSQQ